MNIPIKQKIVTFTPRDDLFDWKKSGSIALTNAIYQVIHNRVDFHRDELLGISSAAFCNYFYHPGYNQHDEEREFSSYSNMISNYGIIESISHYTGISIAEVGGLPVDDLWKLIQFEVLNERAFVSIKEDFSFLIIDGYEESVTRKLFTQEDHHALTDLQNEDPVYANWGLLIRDGGPDRERTPLTRQRSNLLKWVARHGFQQKEFFQETRENYACGVHALELIAQRVGEPSFSEFFSTFIAEFIEKKSAAALCLDIWAQDLAQASDGQVETLLKLASASYKDIVNLPTDDDWSYVFPKMVELERSALGKIREASDYFPSAFA